MKCFMYLVACSGNLPTCTSLTHCVYSWNDMGAHIKKFDAKELNCCQVFSLECYVALEYILIGYY